MTLATRAFALLLGALAAGAAVLALRARRGGAPPAGEAPATGPLAAAPGDLFRDVAEEAGIRFVHRVADGRMDNVVEALGCGGAWLDFDRDGSLDLYLVAAGWRAGVSSGAAEGPAPRNRLFRNRRDGTFEDVTDRAGVGGAAFGTAVAAADYDGDGWIDLYVVNDGPNVLYRNRGDGTFEDASSRAGVGDAGCGTGAAFFDLDGDGRLDLFVANYLELDPGYRLYHSPDGFPGPLAYEPCPSVLYRNRGDGTFEDVSARAGVPPRASSGRAMGVAAADFDGDGDEDLFVANDATANFLLRNDGGRLVECGLEAGVAFGIHGEATAAMAPAVGDYDGDGRPDVLVTDATYSSLYRNLGGGRFEDRVFAAGVAALFAQSPSWGGCWLDFDLDGDLDLFAARGDLHHANGREDLLLENAGDGTFRDASERGGTYFRAALNGRAALPADYDDDGDLDVLVTNLGDRVVLLRNESDGRASWLTVALQGRPPNTQGLGARVTVRAGARAWTREARPPSVYLGQGDPRLHFGLGDAARVDAVEVRWPSGATTVLRDVGARQVLVVREEPRR